MKVTETRDVVVLYFRTIKSRWDSQSSAQVGMRRERAPPNTDLLSPWQHREMNWRERGLRATTISTNQWHITTDMLTRPGFSSLTPSLRHICHPSSPRSPPFTAKIDLTFSFYIPQQSAAVFTSIALQINITHLYSLIFAWFWWQIWSRKRPSTTNTEKVKWIYITHYRMDEIVRFAT